MKMTSLVTPKMTFFERELRKIIQGKYPNAIFVGRTSYVRLSEMNRAKIQFTTCGTADHYEALQMTILNRSDGQIDPLRLRFKDVLGIRQVNSPNFRNGVSPHAWTYNGKTEWYGYQPDSQDYQKLAHAVSDYLEVFQEQTHTADQQWQQTMQ